MLDVRLLGQFEVLRDGKRLDIPTRNAQNLFAYLVLNANQAHRRERLSGLLWPDSAEENARSNLRHELWRLRKAIESKGESYLISTDLTISFSPRSEVVLDVNKLESKPLEKSNPDDLIDALSAYRGELLPGFYDEWVFLERERLKSIFDAKVARLLEILQSMQHWAEVMDWANRWIALGGYPEPAYRALIIAYASTGDMSKAVATYERYARVLQKEMGMKPAEQTQALYKRLKSGWKTEALAPAAIQKPGPPIPALDIALPIIAPPRSRRSNLPRPQTSFIGREQEIRHVMELISSSRLVTITGYGGVGKTRLAIQVAEELASDFKDGVWWIELASLFEVAASSRLAPRYKQEERIPSVEAGALMGADLVAQEVAKALRIPESPDLPPLERVLEHLQDKTLLLALDNCEHLIGACASLAERLLIDCPTVTILATSREALGVAGEKAWLLPPLALPEPGHFSDASGILRSEAVRLYIDRAADILPGYQPGELDLSVIGQICLSLGGIPLAIELAAARMNLLSVQEIAGRLDRRFSLLTGGPRTTLPRHQTLRAAIEWSYDLLSEPEQVLFRRLSIFSGGFTLEAAEAVCAIKEICDEEVLTLLGRLVDKSLLSVAPALQDTDLATRYYFLESISSFGRMKLDEAGETRRMRDRHSAYYVNLVEAAEPELHLQNQNYWYKLLRAENDNLRVVVDWSAESDQAESALRLVGALCWFWFRSGANCEGHDLARKTLALPSAVLFKEPRARALNTAGFINCLLGETALARQLLEEAISILKPLDDRASLAWSYQFLGLVYSYENEYDLAEAAFNEGLGLVGRQENVQVNNLLFLLGDVELQKGDPSRAQKIYEESANIFRSSGSKSFLAYPLRRLGYLMLAQDDISTANKYFQESLALNVEVRDSPGVIASLISLAALGLTMDQPLLAGRLYGAVENRLETISVNLLYPDQAELGKIKSMLLERLDEETFSAAYTGGRGLADEQAIEMAQSLSDRN
jgi:predicted ATPase/DNA-binding SARP family transcriptional activator